ncbi:MAG: nuclear transport factor 2 family protein [Bdellovibrionales bacterium]|nr:nuclear transport factor 2 family protein [Bdellovibrionales bacterium]
MNKMSVQQFFNALDKDHLNLVDEFYAPDVEFRDPIGALHGSAAVKKYYANMYRNVQSVRFDFSSDVAQGTEHVVAWTMTLVASSLNGGQPVVVDGVSHIRYDARGEKVVYHRDYFDMGAFIYEHIPVLGFAVRKIREKMAVH